MGTRMASTYTQIPAYCQQQRKELEEAAVGSERRRNHGKQHDKMAVFASFDGARLAARVEQRHLGLLCLLPFAANDQPLAARLLEMDLVEVLVTDHVDRPPEN